MRERHKIVAGLREAISHAAGADSQTRVTRYNVPDNIDVKKLREGLGMSQPAFALRFGFNLQTLRQWEQGRRNPDGPARTLLTVIEHSPDTVARALMEAPVRRAAVV
jgi:putative transcriptional regulator